MRHTLLAATLAGLLPAAAHAQCQTQVLDAPVPPNLGFATTLALSGDRALVGQPLADVAGDDSGVVHAYRWNAGVWELEQMLTPSDAAPDAKFGRLVAADGDRAFIGTTDHDERGTNSGAVYEYLWDGAAWVENARIAPAGVLAGDFFGSDIELRGGRAVIGATGDDEAWNNAGAIYVFELVAGAWVETAKLLPPPGLGIQNFGYPISLDGDRFLTGSQYADYQGTDKGVVLIYEFVAGQWEGVGRLQGSSLQMEGRFGASIALEGELALASSRKFTQPYWRGRVHTFERDDLGEWNEVHLLHRDGPVERDGLGEYLDLEGDSLLVSAADLELPGGGWGGAAFLYAWTLGGWVQQSELVTSYLDNFASGLVRDGELALIARGGSGLRQLTAWSLPAIVEPSCLCTADAPCGNEVPTAGCRCSTGAGVLLRSCGSSSAGLDDLRFALHAIPPNQTALLFTGDQFGSGFPFRDGRLCAVGFQTRLATVPASSAGFVDFGPGLGAIGGWEAGEERWFQTWYRDPSGPCGSGSNLSSAVHVAFVP